MDPLTMLTATLSSWLKTGFARRGFGSDENAATAPITAMCAIPLVMIAGVAVDASRLSSARIEVQAAADAAALTAAAAYGTGNENYTRPLPTPASTRTSPRMTCWRTPI
jgi:Flp pilus assembly protein TadG